MAGHSKFKNIMHRKGAQDKKRAKLFTKLVRDVIIAARGGNDPEMNAALRAAITAAKAGNLPKDRIDNAIKKGSNPQDGENYSEIRYEGFAAGGIAIIVEALTDNKNRTASYVRSVFSKCGGNLGETGSVSYMFDRKGQIIYPTSIATTDEIFEAAIEAGAESCESDEDYHEILCQPDDFAQVKNFLFEKFGHTDDATLTWLPQNTIDVTGEDTEKLLKLIDQLEDSDDVQLVCGNYNVIES